MWPKVCGHPSSTLRIKVYESMFFMVWAVPLVLNLHDLAYKDISDKQCATDFVTTVWWRPSPASTNALVHKTRPIKKWFAQFGARNTFGMNGTLIMSQTSSPQHITQNCGKSELRFGFGVRTLLRVDVLTSHSGGCSCDPDKDKVVTENKWM